MIDYTAPTKLQFDTCNMDDIRKTINNMDLIPKTIKKLSFKRKKKGLERDGSRDSQQEEERRHSSPPAVFDEKGLDIPNFEPLPPLSSSECLRHAIAEAVSHHLFENEKVYVTPNQIITSLINATGSISQTNPRKYNKTKLILKDRGNQRISTPTGTYWEVHYYVKLVEAFLRFLYILSYDYQVARFNGM